MWRPSDFRSKWNLFHIHIKTRTNYEKKKTKIHSQPIRLASYNANSIHTCAEICAPTTATREKNVKKNKRGMKKIKIKTEHSNDAVEIIRGTKWVNWNFGICCECAAKHLRVYFSVITIPEVPVAIFIFDSSPAFPCHTKSPHRAGNSTGAHTSKFWENRKKREEHNMRYTSTSAMNMCESTDHPSVLRRQKNSFSPLNGAAVAIPHMFSTEP